MTTPYKRKILFKANRFQQPIVNLILFPSIPAFLISFLYIIYFYYSMTASAMDTSLNGKGGVDLEAMTRITIVILILLWIFAFIMLLWVYRVSNKMVGAFERILAEMDSVLASKGKRHIKARKGDLLANELLKRVNAFIDKIPN